MKTFQDFGFLLLQVAVYLKSVVGDPIMGPFKCPMDAVCVETTSCTAGYYLTADGQPYHCGPRVKLDSMVCCYDPNKAVPIPVQNLPSNDDQDLVTGTQSTNDFDPYLDTSGMSDNDDPPPTSSSTLPLALPDLPQDEYSLVEDPDEQDNVIHFNNLGDESSFRNQFDDFRSKIRNSMDPINYQPDGRQEQEPIMYRSYGQDSYRHQQPLDNQILSQEEGRRPSRQSIYDACPCEKGDQGERGPPGEPGKVIYVPVFVNANQPYQGPQQPYQQPYQQYQQDYYYPSSQNYQFNYPNPQQYYPNFPNNQNPTILPYTIPTAPVSGPNIILQPVQRSGRSKPQVQPSQAPMYPYGNQMQKQVHRRS